MKSLMSLILLIYMVPAMASRADFDHSQSSNEDRRTLSSISDLLPDLEALDCTPKCEGKRKSCAGHKDLDSCLNDSVSKGCFWSCN